jgi:nucleoside-diphosphate-sugar epimerase
MTLSRILVTGAAGFIGRGVVDVLREMGYEVRAVDVHLGRKPDQTIEIADLLQRESSYRVTEGVDAVIHLANWPNVHRATPTQVFVDNVTMNQNLFQAVAERGIKRVVYASSIQAISGHRQFGDERGSGLPYLPLDGDIPSNPSNAYGLSKAAGESQCRWLATVYDVAVAAVRLPMVARRALSEYPRERMQPNKWHVIDEAFLGIRLGDAARLMEALLRRHESGYRCVQAGCRDQNIPTELGDIIDTFYRDVPLKRPRESLTSLCDLDVLERDFGWVPQESLWETVTPTPTPS